MLTLNVFVGGSPPVRSKDTVNFRHFHKADLFFSCHRLLPNCELLGSSYVQVAQHLLLGVVFHFSVRRFQGLVSAGLVAGAFIAELDIGLEVSGPITHVLFPTKRGVI